MTRRRGRRLNRPAVILTAALATSTALVLGACTTPPIGWQGAGRMQTLPAPQPDSGGPMGDAGAEAESPGPDPGSVMGLDPEDDAGQDASVDGDAS